MKIIQSLNDFLKQITKSQKMFLIELFQNKWNSPQKTIKMPSQEKKNTVFLQYLKPQSILEEELKTIQNKLKKHHPPLINFQTQKLSTEFQKLLSQIARYCQVLKPFIQIHSSTNEEVKIQRIFIEHFLNLAQKKLLGELEAEKLDKAFLEKEKEEKKEEEIDFLIEYKLKEWEQSFSKKQSLMINTHYSSLEQIENLIQYDFKVLLEKIQSPQSNLPHPLKELKKLAGILHSMNFYADYYYPIEILGKHQGKNILPKNNIEEFIELLRNIQEKNTLVLLIAYLESNPSFRPIQEPAISQLVQKFSKNLKKEAIHSKERILYQLEEKKIQSMVQILFGEKPIQALKSYHPSKNPKLIQARCEPYLYFASLNYLLYFLTQRYSKSLEKQILQIIQKYSNKERIEEQTEKGQKEKKQKEEFCISWQEIQILQESTSHFDASLEENSQKSLQIQRLLGKSRNLAEKQALKDMIQAINQKAKSLIEKALTEFSTLHSLLRPILEKNTLELDPLLFQELQKNYEESQQFLLLLKTLFTKDQNYIQENHTK